MDDYWRKEEKLAWFAEHRIENIEFDNITPDKNNNWLNIADNNWEKLIPVCNKEVKNGKSKEAIFELYSLGIVTTRDEWAYDLNKEYLEQKIKFFFSVYNEERKRWSLSKLIQKANDFVDRTIKWTSELENYMVKGTTLKYSEDKINLSLYRPFFKTFVYYERIFTHRVYQQNSIFPLSKKVENRVIGFNGIDSPKPFTLLAFKYLTDLNSLSPAAGGTKCLPLYKFNDEGIALDNITDWALQLFINNYKTKLTKEDIFHYVYAVLHHPAYRTKYELNLKREFPRIPLYDDFQQWAAWGKQLMDLHINYETVAPYPLERTDIVIDLKAGVSFDALHKAKLKAYKEEGEIEIDAFTTLSGIPKEAWEYKLGNRSALEWILDQYKEKKPSDPTIAEKFNTYRFSDYKEEVITLLMKVCRVSVETVKLSSAMSEG